MRDHDIDGFLVGRPIQEINEVSTTQHYPVGMIHERHGRRWRYCHANEALLFSGRGCPNLAYYTWVVENTFACGAGTVITETAKGEQKIIVKVDDCAVTNCRTVDYFVGGILLIWCKDRISSVAGRNILQLRISGQDASVANADTDYEDLTLYLDEPLPQIVEAADGVDVYPSPYRNIGYSNTGTVYSRVACIPMDVVEAGSWFWGQTRGPCWVTPTGGITTANVHEVGFATDGCVIPKTAAIQLAGYMIHKGDGTQDDSLLMLQLE